MSHALTDKDHFQIQQYLTKLSIQDLTKVAMNLGLDYSRFLRVSPESLLQNMVQAWLRKDDDVIEKSGEPSWDSLCKALEECGHKGTALNIKMKGKIHHHT